MTEHHTPDDPAILDPVEATAAKPVKGMPYVLGISIVSAVVLLGIALVIFS